MQPSYILAIDQGTTSSRALIFDEQLQCLGRGQHEFAQHFPASGWVEHDPEDLWQTTLAACRDALQTADLQAAQLTSLGITNQRETTLIWERATGQPVHRAIVWQDRRTAAYCQQLQDDGQGKLIQQKTGLLPDPYFSATKIRWILDEIPDGQRRAEAGELCFGTVDSFLLWRFTNGREHAIDATNASRTLLMNLAQCRWDQELLDLFRIPAAMLPSIRDNACDFGTLAPEHLGAAVPVQGMIGDQQGALLGQACLAQGQLKSTYGTGCFALVNTGEQPLVSNHRLLSTLAWQLNGQATYALEGSIFMAGATVQWLRDQLGIIAAAPESEDLAADVPWDQTEVLVPAFTGLGAPYWDPTAQAAIFGMTRATGKKELAAAALRSVAWQSHDLLQAMSRDGQSPEELRVDGGMTDNDWFMQALADTTGLKVRRAASAESTIRGAAFLAGLQSGVFQELEQISDFAGSNGDFMPLLSRTDRDNYYQSWLAAIDKIR